MQTRLARATDEAAWRTRFRREQLGPRMQRVPALSGASFATVPADGRDVDSTTFAFREVHAGQRVYRSAGRRLRVAGVYVDLSVTTTFPHERLKLVQTARRFGKFGSEYRTSFLGMHPRRLDRSGFHDPDAPHRGWFVDVESPDSAYWDEYRYAGRAGIAGRPAELVDSPGVSEVPGGYEFWTCAIAEWEGRRRIVGALWWGFEVNAVRRYFFLRAHQTSVYQPHAQERPPAAFFAALDRWDGEPLGLEV